MRMARALVVIALLLASSVTSAPRAAGQIAWTEFEFLFEGYDDERAAVVVALQRELAAELEAVDLSNTQIGIELYGPFPFLAEADITKVTVMVVDPATCQGTDCLIVHLEQNPATDDLSVAFTLYGTGGGGFLRSDLGTHPGIVWTFQQTIGEVQVTQDGPIGTPVVMLQE